MLTFIEERMLHRRDCSKCEIQKKLPNILKQGILIDKDLREFSVIFERIVRWLFLLTSKNLISAFINI